MRNPLRLLTQSPDYVFGRFSVVRRTYSHAKRIRQRLSGSHPTLRIGERYGPAVDALSTRDSGLVKTSISSKQHVENLSRDSFSMGVSLSEDGQARLLAAATTSALCGTKHLEVRYEELSRSADVRREEAMLSVPNSAQLECVRSIAADPKILEVVGEYLAYVPERVSSWLFWSVHNEMTHSEREARFQTVRFHYDVHGYNFVYVNFYLTDVDNRSGAHVLIQSSHKQKRLRHLIGPARLDDAQVGETYARDRIKIITGYAGSGFFEDTSCYHKALAPIDRDRLMLQLRYQ